MTPADDGSPVSAPDDAEGRGARRTQAERTAAMRQRLLDATVDCLVTYGYAGTTTMRVAEMAGVTRGAQIHHFRSKEDLVIAAIEHLAGQRMQRAIDETWRIKESDDIPSAILDFLWEIHRSKMFVATVELWIAARTDPVLAAQVQRVEPVVIGAVLASVAQMLPDEAGRRDLRHATYTAMDAMRGLMLWKFVDGDDDRLQRRWTRARARLRSDIEKALNS
jgi:AcrR family transcriptional regulator